MRRPAISPGALLAAVMLAAGAVHAGEAAVEPLPMTEIAPGVHVHHGSHRAWSAGSASDVANLGVVVGSRCAAVIDTGGSPALGERLRAAIRRLTALPVCYVINTHVHPDHVLGNVALAGGSPPPEFVGHVRLGPSLSARAPYYLEAFRRESGQALAAETVVYPTRTVAERATLDLGERRLQLRAWPTAHTDNDLTVYDERTGTLFTGDLLFIGHLPVIDGRLRGWLEAIGELKALDVQRAVPGHGDTTADLRRAIAPQEAYLSAVRDGVRAAIKAGVPMSRAVDELAGTGTAGWQLAAEFHRRNLTAAYAELEWED
ncbi:MBL fold metallo-hydrolase [Thauera sinica]|nr:MBL fold metallo-hydrolase [Thauera sp. K11]